MTYIKNIVPAFYIKTINLIKKEFLWALKMNKPIQTVTICCGALFRYHEELEIKYYLLSNLRSSVMC